MNIYDLSDEVLDGYNLDYHNDRISPNDLFCYRVWFKTATGVVFPKISNQDNIGDLFEEYQYDDVIEFERLKPKNYLAEKIEELREWEK